MKKGLIVLILMTLILTGCSKKDEVSDIYTTICQLDKVLPYIVYTFI